MRNSKFLFLVMFLLGSGLAGFSQDRGDSGKIKVRKGEKFDFVFNRTVLIPLNQPDSVAMDPSRSGSTFLGVSFNFPVGKVVAFKVEPGVNWSRVTYNDDTAKYYPTENSAYLWEKQRGIFAEMALGVKFNIVRNVEDKVKLFAEIGGSGGYMMMSSYRRRRYSAVNGKLYTEKFHKADGLLPYRFGPYFRFGSNLVSVYAYYRLSDFYISDQYRHPDRGYRAVDYPTISPLEVGFSIHL